MIMDGSNGHYYSDNLRFYNQAKGELTYDTEYVILHLSLSSRYHNISSSLQWM